MTTSRATIMTCLVLVAATVALWLYREDPSGNRSALPPLAYEELTGSVFYGGEGDPLRAPGVRDLPLPATPDATAVWGATGRDARGHIWVGVSATRDGMSAHLLEFDPAAERWQDRGAVVEQLKRAGLFHSGEGQIKIHSKIVQGGDGLLYFASSDEEGETEEGALPRWGGHLWRIDPQRAKWEHLFAAPEGLVAVSGVGRYVYVLGYWGHVLYQYDTQSGKHRRVVVGSIGAHESRNFLADVRGHAYVPRVRLQAGVPIADLVEFDSDLRELAATPLEFYLDRRPALGNHGITGVVYVSDGRLLFTTHRGYLYAIEPRSDGPARVNALGWLHPDGEAYAPSLFVWGGPSRLAGLTHRNDRYEWVVYEMGTRVSTALPLDVRQLRKLLLYGSVTRDNAGRAYLGGWAAKDERSSNMRPVVLQIEAPR